MLIYPRTRIRQGSAIRLSRHQLLHLQTRGSKVVPVTTSNSLDADKSKLRDISQHPFRKTNLAKRDKTAADNSPTASSQTTLRDIQQLAETRCRQKTLIADRRLSFADRLPLQTDS